MRSAALSNPAARADNVRLGIIYMVASVFLFSIQNAVGKWLAQSYPIPMLVFFRSAVAIPPAALLVWHAGGGAAFHTRRPGAQVLRATIWGGSNVASFFAYHLLPLADGITYSFTAPLFLTALSWPVLREPVGKERWIAVLLGFAGVLVMARPSGGGAATGIACAIVSAVCSAVGSLYVRDLCRTETSAAIVFYTAVVIAALSVPFLPFFWLTPSWAGLAELCALGLMGAVSQYWTTQALAYAPAAAVSPFNYTALIWGLIIGFMVWGEVPNAAMLSGAAIVTAAGLFLVRHEAFRRRAPRPAS
ncbi:MAG TPA: DMT family transporter [Stellaceae bacterium]|nr:DMT family transporter [Stellaceae bacterium]